MTRIVAGESQNSERKSLVGRVGLAGQANQVGLVGRRGSPHLTDATECVDDPRSAAYNTIVEHTGSADWTSAEHMRRDDDLYSLGAVIEHNPQNVRGDGSCIFFHVWSGPDSTTVGCTAMDKQKLANMLSWLGDDSLFVQLPRAEYRAVQDHWGLPPQ